MSIDDGPAGLDPASYVPLYKQLAALLRRRIKDGEFREGDQLPSEPTLVKEYAVSRATAIAALDDLVRSKEAFRRRGRGTFVTKPFLSQFSLSKSFTEDMLERGLVPSSATVAFGQVKPDLTLSTKLSVNPKLPCFRLVRLRLANGDPVALQTAYLPVSLYPGLRAEMFENHHLYEVMRKTFSLKPTWAEAIVEARLATETEAAALDVTTADPLLVVWHVTLDESLRELEWVCSAYRADRFSFASGRQSTAASAGEMPER